MKFPSSIIAIALAITACSSVAADNNSYILDDAERFASIFSLSQLPSAEQLQQDYLTPGSKGIEIFTPHRIKDADNLAAKIAKKPQAYEKALKVCLPAAKSISIDASQILNQVQQLLEQPKSAPTYIIFGANNSGGTASHEGLVLGLEVICRFSDTKEQAEQELLTFVAHEVVHVYQSRQTKNEANRFSLLRQVMREGFADFIANKVMGKVAMSEQERHQYGLKHEAELWQQFEKVMHGKELKPWMYGDTGNEWPKDMGYWIGKRIAQAYYAQAEDKALAIQTLLALDDPKAILQDSGYQQQTLH